MAGAILGNLFVLALWAILLALSLSIKDIRGKFFLVLYLFLNVIQAVGNGSLSVLYWEANILSRPQYFQLSAVFSVISSIAFFSLAMFIFSIWSSNRIKTTTKDVLFSFNGRIPRSTFWIVYGIMFINNFGIGAIFNGNVSMFGTNWALIGVFSIWLLISIWMSLAIFTKRWHDLNRSGWMSLLMLIPIIGTLVVYSIWLLISIWSSLALFTKQWHDLNRSGWMSLLMFIPIIGILLVLGWCGFTQGDVGSNEYGEDPFYREITETNSISDL